MIDLSIHEAALDRAVQRAARKTSSFHLRAATQPALIPDAIKQRLDDVGLWD